MDRFADILRALDPRLKLAIALFLGPGLWMLPPLSVTLCLLFLGPTVYVLSKSQPVGSKMIRSLFTFIIFWVVLKAVMDTLSDLPVTTILMQSGELGLRLTSLLLLGLGLALSTSARALGMAVSWGLKPFIGAERAWKVALSLALMVHFLPMCLSTMNQVKETVASRCPHFGFRQKMVLIPQVVLRSLGQKTWNQTLAVAGRGLENAGAWEPDFTWHQRDTACAVSATFAIAFLCIV